MAVFYRLGTEGLAQDPAKSFQYYLAAAENNHAIAQWEVGMGFIRGTAGKTDIVKAVQWFQKSAKNGDSNGMISLAVMYANGMGVARDYDQTIRLKNFPEQVNQLYLLTM